MDIKKGDVIALKLTFILIRDYQFNFVVVQNDEQNIWLANGKNSNYNLIKISNKPSGSTVFHHDYIEKVKNGVKEVLKREVKLLEIYTGNSTAEFVIEDEATVWGTCENSKMPKELEDIFPNVSMAIVEIEDPEKEYEKMQANVATFRKISLQSSKMKLDKKIPLVTIAVSLLCILVYLLRLYLKELTIIDSAIAIVLGAYYKAFVLGMNQYWRFLTAGFVHMEFGHLIFNLYAFFSIGRFLEPLLGRCKYLLVLLVGIIMGSLFEFSVGGNLVAYGLSGGVYALLALLIIVLIKSGMIKNPRILAQIVIIAVVCLFDNFSPNVGWLAHLGGLISGLLLGFIFIYPQNKNLQRSTTVAFGLLLGLILYMATLNTELDYRFILIDNEVYKVYGDIGFPDYGTKVRVRMNEYYKKR